MKYNNTDNEFTRMDNYFFLMKNTKVVQEGGTKQFLFTLVAM